MSVSYDEKRKCWYFVGKIKGKWYKRLLTIDGRHMKSEKEARTEEQKFRLLFDPKVEEVYKMKWYELFDLWLNHWSETVKETTSHNVGRTLTLHIKNKIPNKQLRKLSMLDLTCWRKQIDSLNAKVKFKNELLAYLKKIFVFADNFFDIRIKFAERLNPFKDYSPQEPKVRTVYTPEQLKLFIDQLDNELLKTFYLIAYTSGKRPGEVRALQVKDFDRENNTLAIYKTATNKNKKGRVEIYTTKTETSIRSVVLPQFAAEKLSYFLDHHHPDPNPQSFIFYSTGRGPTQPISERYLNDHKNAASQKAGLPQIDNYEFRHSFATICSELENGNLSTIAVVMGHKSTSTTSEHYDLSGKLKVRKLAEDLDGAISYLFKE